MWAFCRKTKRVWRNRSAYLATARAVKVCLRDNITLSAIAYMRAFRLLALPITWLSLTAPLWANDVARQPRSIIAPDREAMLMRDAADGALDQHSLLQAALIASGVRDELVLERYAERVQGWRATLQREAEHVTSTRDKSATVLAFLYRDVLTGPYDAGCSDLAATLDQGRYNCVTASLLFWICADALDLSPRGWHSPGHVRIKLAKPSELEIETTCRTWFSQPQRSTDHTTGRELSPTAMVAKLYYNRGVQALDRADFAAAVTALQRSTTLDPLDTTSQRNLLAALNNGALAHCQNEQFATALESLAMARAIDPHYPPVQANELHIRQRWVVALCEARRFAEAMDVLAASSATPYLQQCAGVYQLWAEDLMQRGEAHAALAKVELGLVIAPTNASLQSLRQKLRGA